MSAAATVVTRADFRPGMVVERRERFLVRSVTYPAENAGRAFRNGARKLTPLDGEWVIVRGRWTVWRCPSAMSMWRDSEYVDVRAGQWVAHAMIDDEDGYREPFAAFRTHAEAIAYADHMARTEKQQGDDQ